MTTVPVSIRVGAYIIRSTPGEAAELLLFKHPDSLDAPFQVPGGGVDPGESLEAALHREVWEESGLSGMVILRQLGMVETCWIQPCKTVLRRYFFLLEAPADVLNQWEHVVKGTGVDAGMTFTYFWHRPDLTFSLGGDQGHFLRPEQVPELYLPVPAF